MLQESDERKLLSLDYQDRKNKQNWFDSNFDHGQEAGTVAGAGVNLTLLYSQKSLKMGPNEF